MESIYESSLCHELNLQGVRTQNQLSVPVKYKNAVIKAPLYLDIFVENRVIVEVKATEVNQSIHRTQLLTYLRLTGCKLGLLINFGKVNLREGIFRVVNGL